MDRAAMATLAPSVAALAEAEGLGTHAASARMRSDDRGGEER
jgi:histidinol dehydrogenase